MPSSDFTAAEAAFVTGRPLSAIRKAVSEGALRARRRGTDRAGTRLLGLPELRYLRALDRLQDRLSPVAQGELYAAVRALGPDEHRVELGPLAVDLTTFDREVEERLRRLGAVREAVDGHGQKDPVLRGTDVSVYVIAALVGGGGPDEALYAYPSLSPEQVMAAAEYARAYPKKGRPYPAKSFKRMLTELEWPDDGEEADDETPAVEP